MANFKFFTGVVTLINDFWTESPENSGCNRIMKVMGRSGDIVNFVVTPDTCFIDHVMIKIGFTVTGFYDADAPVPLIYPPQYRALVMARVSQNQNIKVSYFDNRLISSDGMLRLNITPFTPIMLENGQAFSGSPANRNLIVVYGASTHSIPALTTPYSVIVMCRLS